MLKRFRRAQRRTAALVALAACAQASACLYDEDDRCGPGRVYAGSLCVCAPGTQNMAGKCVEVVEAGPVAGGLGEVCNASDLPCADATFSECQVPEVAEEGYCTRHDCQSDDDCGGDYFCNEGEDPTFCQRSPTGLEEPCSSDDDCKDYDANSCSMNPAGRTCVVTDCTEGSCPPGYACMDFSMFVPGTPLTCAMSL